MTKSNINYIQYGKGQDVVLLHGWGQNIEMMRPLGNKIVNCRVTIIDFPGFGDSIEPEYEWYVSDYVEALKELLDELKIKTPILVGHSFGGRVAIKYSSLYPVKRIVLLGSPCFRKRELSKKEKILKKLKKLPLLNKFSDRFKNVFGSTDYRSASPLMKKILVNVINEDLSEDAKKIDVPVLLIWGSNDQAVPVSEAKELESILKDGGLVVIDGCSHYAYLEALEYVSSIINNFVEVKK